MDEVRQLHSEIIKKGTELYYVRPLVQKGKVSHISKGVSQIKKRMNVNEIGFGS